MSEDDVSEPSILADSWPPPAAALGAATLGRVSLFRSASVVSLFTLASRVTGLARELLIAANRILAGHLDARSFITMSYAVVDVDRGTMTYARAGHTPLLHLPAGPDATSQAHVADGMVLGLKFDNEIGRAHV